MPFCRPLAGQPQNMADRPRRTGPPDKTIGSNTRTMMKTVTIYTDGIKTAMRFYR